MKLKVLKNTKILANSKIRIGEDFSPDRRKVRRELIPYLREAKKKRAQGILEGQAGGEWCYDIDYLRRNVQLESRSNAVDNLADKILEVAEEITQQLTGNVIRESTEGRASNTEIDVWRNEGESDVISYTTRGRSTGYYVTAKTAADAGTED
jgi:hypothetical protein